MEVVDNAGAQILGDGYDGGVRCDGKARILPPPVLTSSGHQLRGVDVIFRCVG
jgi:hypothetical protein